ncbi:hypothetical protein XNC3_1960057 [Xenorhabdus nematophila F1]|uniref:hypothetical protein n=1 Tax=Xenorhabdus nematophila TaxID=628 RepID=UPI00032752F2|nr:hypothetical protein [Xenorhabdus nematophila]CCW30387.1 hypothetical protein XNC3_1960057 [Xenorhabdus nematophila F1]CEF30280.1 hypothetical protein XNW1_2390017 [Xenorhabdus nematophila str. Websteri]
MEISKKYISLGIRSDQKIFLYQGGLIKGRGIEILLETFENLKDDKNVLVCMGYGPLESLIKIKTSKSSNIFFHHAGRTQYFTQLHELC